MNLSLDPVAQTDKAVLRQLMELYLYDFSEYDDMEINEHGYFGYSYLDPYWYEENRHPFFIRLEGKIVGFALISDYCFVVQEEDRWSMSEYFIMRKYRRRGIGQKIAHQLFERFPGTWEVVQYLSNRPSVHFWKTCIQAYIGKDAELTIHTFEDGKREALIFSTGN